MQFSIGVEYALHCLFYMINLPQGKAIGIKDIAAFQGVSESYLSKIFTKLRKSGIVRSITGVKGGYELARRPDDITFWDVVEAVEGSSHMFQCAEIRQNTILNKNNPPKCSPQNPCTIKVVMLEAEEQMRKYLAGKTLAWLHKEVYEKFPQKTKEEIELWFNNAISK